MLIFSAARVALAAFVGCMSTHANAKLHSDTIGMHVEALWRVQSFEFHHSSSVAYSCVGLRNKITLILEAVGVRERPIVSVRCSSALVRTALVRITLASPLEATPENIQMVTSFDPRAELIARMHGRSLPTAAEIERFRASWRSVSLVGKIQSPIDASDCGLLRGMVKQVFPRLAVRVQRRPMCIDGVTRPTSLKVVALMRDSAASTAPR